MFALPHNPGVSRTMLGVDLVSEVNYSSMPTSDQMTETRNSCGTEASQQLDCSSGVDAAVAQCGLTAPANMTTGSAALAASVAATAVVTTASNTQIKHGAAGISTPCSPTDQLSAFVAATTVSHKLAPAAVISAVESTTKEAVTSAAAKSDAITLLQSPAADIAEHGRPTVFDAGETAVVVEEAVALDAVPAAASEGDAIVVGVEDELAVSVEMTADAATCNASNEEISTEAAISAALLSTAEPVVEHAAEVVKTSAVAATAPGVCEVSASAALESISTAESALADTLSTTTGMECVPTTPTVAAGTAGLGEYAACIPRRLGRQSWKAKGSVKSFGVFSREASNKARGSWEEQQQQREAARKLRQREQEILAEKAAALRKRREKREEKKKRKEETDLKGMQVQVIKNTAKIRKWSKNARKSLVKMSAEMIHKLYGVKL